MEELYLKSLKALKEYDNKPSVKEWNKIAVQYCFMSSKTMCYISADNWSNLCDKVRKNKSNNIILKNIYNINIKE